MFHQSWMNAQHSASPSPSTSGTGSETVMQPPTCGPSNVDGLLTGAINNPTRIAPPHPASSPSTMSQKGLSTDKDVE